MPTELKVKRVHPDAVLPAYATDGSACFDLRVVGLTRPVKVFDSQPLALRTGLAFEVPNGHAMLVFSRSGHGFNYDTRLANCVGVIDSDYRGEVMVRLTCDSNRVDLLEIKPGDRIAQAMLVPIPRVQLVEVDGLAPTARGEGGFGSTGA
ncbi:dUTP diphosphatase [Microvirga sp. 17 mud 1-3]|nr:dUTP diphosphatase [Microvirga sp. 17 mud 1-3]